MVWCEQSLCHLGLRELLRPQLQVKAFELNLGKFLTFDLLLALLVREKEVGLMGPKTNKAKKLKAFLIVLQLCEEPVAHFHLVNGFLRL